MSLLKKLWEEIRPLPENMPVHLKEGILGERYAARYLRWHGYRIVCRNFVSGRNEIDIIARKGASYVFCEVKTRTQHFGEQTPFGRPGAAVDKDKQRCLIAAATTFYKRHQKENMRYRFDVLEVYLTPAHKLSHIHHIKGAFTR